MRIALIGPSAPLRGGIAQFNDRLAIALARRGCDVECLSFSRMYPSLLFPGKTQYETEASADVGSAGLATTSGPTAGDDVAERAAVGAPMLAPALRVLDSLRPASWRATAERADADVAVIQWWHPFFAPALASVAARLARRGVPVIFVCHNLAPHERVPGARLLSALALRRAAAFVATSERDATRIRERYPSRPVAVVVPPPAVAPPCPHGDDRGACERALGLPAARRRALFFGYVREYKGLPTAIEALAATAADVQLVVAGEIYHRTRVYYEALADAAGVADRVVLLDRFIPAAEVTCCFRSADVAVLPYWHASQSAVVPLAMAYGRAVVASAVGGIPEILDDGVTGLLVPPRDAPALARALTRALDHAAVWGEAAAAAARRYSFASAAATIEELARSLSSVSAPC